ncbi:MAG: hypothetical protein ACHQUC_05020 [Chlamydiales bacterium]
MSNSGNSIKDEAIREIAAGTITNAFQLLGGAYTRDVFRDWFTNNTNGDIYLSTDGVTLHKKLPAFSGRASDEKTNDFFRRTGTQWWIKFDVVPAAPSGWFGLEVEYV